VFACFANRAISSALLPVTMRMSFNDESSYLVKDHAFCIEPVTAFNALEATVHLTVFARVSAILSKS
jgi:hypothetical protein